jgi:hypothetical protein
MTKPLKQYDHQISGLRDQLIGIFYIPSPQHIKNHVWDNLSENLWKQICCQITNLLRDHFKEQFYD